ncbi:kinase-like domain-containing protein [Russula emetica]|nr:kinase-like domain-containing protein [Russula emetica]
MPQSVQSPIHSSLQKGANPSTSPSNHRASTGDELASVSVASAPTQVDVDEPILFVSCFHSLGEEDPEIENDELLQTVEVTSDFESQVEQIFGVGLGYMSEDEVVKHGEIASPKVTPEAVFAPTLEPMSAVVEWWEPTVNPAIESDVAMAVKSKGETDGFETIPLDQNQVTCVPSTDIGRSSLSRQPPEPAPVCGQNHLECRPRRPENCPCCLAEQRIIREVSRYPFLLGLLASFRGVHGLYLVSEYCCSTLFDGRFHMPESYASAELASAVNHLHSLGIIHQDIRLENVMVKNDGHVVLGDFDLAVRLETASSPAPRPNGSLPGGKSNALKTRGVCGTLPYMVSLRSLDEGENPIFNLPAAWIAAFGDSGTCLNLGTGVPPAREDDEALLRTSIRSLDIEEEPVLELPSGWKEACVSASHVAVPSLSQSEATRKTSVLPKLKSLWKRATSKFGSRRV